MWSSLRDFARPIGDDEIPALGRHSLRAARAMAVLLAAAAPVYPLLIPLLGMASAERGMIGAVASLALAAVAIAFAHSKMGARRPTLAFFVATWCSQLTVWTSSYADGFQRLDISLTLLPYLAGFSVAFVPWRPRYSLAQFVPSTLLPVALAIHVGLPLRLDPGILLATGFIVAAAAAIAAQLNRRVWRELAQVRQCLVAADRMSSLGQMTAGLAHELKTPLAAARNCVASIECLVDELGRSIGHPDVTEDDLREVTRDLKKNATMLVTSIDRATRFVHAIREHTGGMHETVSVEFAVARRVESVLAMLSHEVRHSRVIIDASGIDPAAVLRGDPGKFEQVLTNLVSNAVHACDEAQRGRTILLATEQRKGGLAVVVHDDGPGVPEKIRATVFEPLFTTRSGDRGGTGLGLSVSRDIAEGAFGGALNLVPSAVGARFEMWCPHRDEVHTRARLAWSPASGG